MARKGIGGIMEFFTAAAMLILLLFGFAGSLQSTIDLSEEIFLLESSLVAEQQMYMTESYLNESIRYAVLDGLSKLASQGALPDSVMSESNSRNRILYWYNEDTSPVFTIPHEVHGYERVELLTEQYITQLFRKFAGYDFTQAEFFVDTLPADSFSINLILPAPPSQNIFIHGESSEKMSFKILRTERSVETPVAEFYKEFTSDQKVVLPYWVVYQRAVEEAKKASPKASNDGKKDLLTAETRSLPDRIIHEDVYCEPAATSPTHESRPKSGIRTVAQLQPSCMSVYEMYSLQSGENGPRNRIENAIEQWSTGPVSYTVTEIAPNTLVRERNAISYDSQTDVESSVSACGCKQVPLCCTAWEGKCEGEEGCESLARTACESSNDALECRWNDQFRCIQQRRDPNICTGCDVAYKKVKREATCDFTYEYAADALVEAKHTTPTQVLTSEGWKEFAFRFMERFRVVDSTVERPVTVRTGV